MKPHHLPFLALFMVAVSVSHAQELNAVQEHLGSVQTGKSTLYQELSALEQGMSRLMIAEEDIKGKRTESQYDFSFGDIDKNTIRAITQKDVITVRMAVKGQQKLIRVSTAAGDKVSYADEISWYATDGQNAEALEAGIKSLVAAFEQTEEKRLSLSGYRAHLDWLTANVEAVELPSKQFIQRIEATDVPGGIRLQQDENTAKKNTARSYELNLSILNPASIEYKISGDEFTVYAETRRGIKGIKYFEDGQLKDYVKDIRIHALSVTNGKDIYKVLSGLIPLSEEEFAKSIPDFASAQSALDFLGSRISEVTSAEAQYEQELRMDGEVAHLKIVSATPKETIENEYRFHFGDINGNAIDYSARKDLLYVEIPVRQQAKFIAQSKNGEVQNYGSTCELYFHSIEDAIKGTAALKKLSEIYETRLSDQAYKGTSLTKAIADVNAQLGQVTIGDETFDVRLELTDAKEGALTLTTVQADMKKSTETILEFYLRNINPKNCQISVSGKRVSAELNTRHLEKIVKAYENGEVKPYRYKVEIETASIEQARRIVEIFRAVSGE